MPTNGAIYEMDALAKKTHEELYQSVLCHYGVRYGVRLYGTVRKYGVQPCLYGFRPYIR